MPQMAPMSWLTLFTIFSITFTIFSVLNYYSLIYQPLIKKEQEKLIKKINWKW
uniref:ATP synthase F0 subunit 8 n=1 Tax=Agrilus adelphinus TaxID=2201944 RepID=UPI0023AB4543|nr:ATP synthase F0 subunit 8 [Agrilus adelphinus]WCO09267.1 ATP synthase F0 subunit 8 [Agrilus adelphinus]